MYQFYYFHSFHLFHLFHSLYYLKIFFEFNLEISEITSSSKGRYIRTEPVDEKYVLSFINKFRLQYFNISDPYDLKSPSDTFLEDEIFKTVSDDDDGF